MRTILRVRYYGDTYIATDTADAKRKASCTAGHGAAAQTWLAKFYPELKANVLSRCSYLNLEGVDTSRDKKQDQVQYWDFEHEPARASTKPAAKSQIKAAVVAPAQVDMDPRFAAARKHADTLRHGVRVTVAASVALGLELIRLKEEIGAKHGGARGASSTKLNLKWDELVARETGFSYMRCQDFMKAAKAVRQQFIASKKKGDAEVKLIVQSPPSEWTDADYDAFAAHVAARFDADTFKALMADLFPAPTPTLPPSSSPGLVQGDFYQAMLNAHACVASPIVTLHRTTLNPEVFTRHLDELPLEDLPEDPLTKRPHIHGLLTLQTVLSRVSDDITATIKAKSKRPEAK